MQQAMVCGATLTALLRFVCVDDTRKFICGIYFDCKGYAVATDGNSMMVARIEPFKGESFSRHWNEVQALLQMQTAHIRKRYTFCVQPGSQMPDFPQWRRVWPRELSYKPAEFSGLLLERVRMARRDVMVDEPRNWDPGVTMMIPNGEHGAALAWLPESERHGFAYLVMPFRGPKRDSLEQAALVATSFGAD